MAGYNRIVLVGNLTRDPEYKQLSNSGQAVCKLGLAVNRQFKNRQTGSMIQEVCYIDIDVWGAQAESCREYLQKGRSVLIEGRLKLDSWKDQEGQTRSKHTVVADRVVFLYSNTNADAPVTGAFAERSDSTAQSDRLDPNNALEKDIMDQLDSIKGKKAAAPAPAPKAKQAESTDDGTASAAFQDEPPFEDDLPF